MFVSPRWRLEPMRRGSRLMTREMVIRFPSLSLSTGWDRQYGRREGRRTNGRLKEKDFPLPPRDRQLYLHMCHHAAVPFLGPRGPLPPNACVPMPVSAVLCCACMRPGRGPCTKMKPQRGRKIGGVPPSTPLDPLSKGKSCQGYLASLPARQWPVAGWWWVVFQGSRACGKRRACESEPRRSHAQHALRSGIA